MNCIKSISGLRGIIENNKNDTLTEDIIKEVCVNYIKIISKNATSIKLIIGRDGRSSGQKILSWLEETLTNYKIHTIDIGITTTPTLALAIKEYNALGGMMITASHNPQQWNGVKFFNSIGEGLEPEKVNELYSEEIKYPIKENKYKLKKDFISKVNNLDQIQSHINKILNLKIINKKKIASRNWKIAIDGINSSGVLAFKCLLDALQIQEYEIINKGIGAKFGRDPEPLTENLTKISGIIKENSFDIGFATDPDVDRLAILDERGDFFGEEYTLISVADYILKKEQGNTVSNLSSSMILEQITKIHGKKYFSSPVGEINVIKKMKENGAVIGGEGNGGVIYPKLNYCRDALFAAAAILSYLSEYDIKASELRQKFPSYPFYKKKINLTTPEQGEKIIDALKEKYKNQEINLEDGIKINFDNKWIHIRKSNTEPILRIISENFEEKELKTILEPIIGL